ncbi:MAG: FHA domain-containing protein [Gammaproteobacteria bacterium]|nr:FHA domain-containing protein [Gammaproteobacteria bacterium]MCW8911191.1 FHA domain-containing protein [Gammaproteobacteria bacterium]MCW9004975.1 FHA domain-containing protein [Gammaproteobacteria bacterium]MCW9055393.1 FHA domain-containing protein [Gammaproteobacteria bacterium]
MAELIVEVQDESRRNRHYYPVESFPVKIGRGYGNDVIISDPYVCPEHLIVDRDEQGWLVRDLESENGIQGQQETVIRADSGDALIIGHTRIRLFTPDHPVKPARSLREKHNLAGFVTGLAIIWSVLTVLGAGYYVDLYLSTSGKIETDKLIAGSLPILGGVLFWAGLWSLLSYIVKRKLFFYFQLTVSSIYILLTIVTENLVSYIEYNISSMIVVESLSYISSGLLFAVLLYFNMKKALSLPAKRQWLMAHIFSWGLVGVSLFVVMANKPEFNSNPEYSSVLKPPFSQWVSADDLDHFLDDSEKVIDFEDNN